MRYLCIYVVGLALGYMLAVEQQEPCRCQHANDLIEAGFTITDPEGYDVAWFEEGE